MKDNLYTFSPTCAWAKDFLSAMLEGGHSGEQEALVYAAFRFAELFTKEAVKRGHLVVKEMSAETPA